MFVRLTVRQPEFSHTLGRKRTYNMELCDDTANDVPL